MFLLIRNQEVSMLICCIGHQPTGLDQPPYTGIDLQVLARSPHCDDRSFISFFFPLWICVWARENTSRSRRTCRYCQISWTYMINQKSKCTDRLILKFFCGQFHEGADQWKSEVAWDGPVSLANVSPVVTTSLMILDDSCLLKRFCCPRA